MITAGGINIQVGVLGSIEVGSRPNAAEQVTGLAGRLLACLAVEHGRSIDDDVLFDRLWPLGPPHHAIASVRNLVARLRRRHGAALIERVSGGYQLPSTGVVLDICRFEALVADARATDDASAAVAVVEEALALVRGQPFHEVADELWAMPAVASVTEVIAAAEELWAELTLRTGRAGDSIARFRSAATALPHRELRWGQLVRALAESGRRTEALRAVEHTRRALAEFGLTPGADLTALERRLFDADADAVPAGRHRIPIRRDEMVGRTAELTEVLRPAPIVWLEGEAGSGKTRLLAEVADRGTERVVYVQCSARPVSGEGPLAVIAGQLVELVGPVPEPLSFSLAASGSPGFDADARVVAVASGLAEVLGIAASERDLLVMIDDAQSLDDASAPIVGHLAMRTMERVRWIIASRPLDRHSGVVRMRGELEHTGAVRTVRLGPLGLDDVHDLLRAMSPDLTEEARAAQAADVLASTGGHVLLAREVIAQSTGRTGAAAGPPRLDAIVAGVVDALVPRSRAVVELLAIAGGPCPVSVLAAAAETTPPEVLSIAEQLQGAGLLAPLDTGALDLRHELIRQAVRRQVSSADELSMRRRLAQELGDDERFVVLVAEQLLCCGDLLDADERDHCHRAVAAAIDTLLFRLDYATAAGLAGRYLAWASTEPSSPVVASTLAVAARLQVATALIANGDVGRGRSLLGPLIDDAEACGDQRLLADAILALGPLATGATNGRDAWTLAERLVSELPAAESRRRVQLACWAAHHRLNTGDRLGALRLLEVAEPALERRPDPVLYGLVLAVRAQSDTLIGCGPEASGGSLAELRDFARQSGDPAATAAASLLGAGTAFCEGSLDDVRAARDGLAAVATQMPRPDLQWWPLALDAAIELAAGRWHTGRAAVERAARAGRELRVDVAAPVALLQELLLMLLDGRLAGMVTVLAPLAATDDPSSGTVAAYALACVEDGDLDAAAQVATRMAADRGLLVRAGMRWGQVAMSASEVTFAAGHVELARMLWPWLEPYSGTGLALHGAGYFGAVDRCLALLAATLGDTDRAAALIESARTQDAKRGAAAWERRAAADAVRIANR